jgi:hypothetical protein
VDYYNKAPELVKQKLAKDNIRNRRILGYSETYTMYDEATQTFTCNKLAQISDRFAFDVQQYNYKNGLLVRKQLEDTGKFALAGNQGFEVYKECVVQSISNTAFIDRMKAYCDYKDLNSLASRCVANNMAKKYPELSIYYETLGSDKIRALSYQESKLKEEYSYVSKAANICHKVAMQFPDGNKLPKQEIKARLQMIYDDLGLKKKAKATDIANYGFSVKDVKIPTNDGRVNGFELRKVG